MSSHFFQPYKGEEPSGEAKADLVRWEVDLGQPSNSWLRGPRLILDLPPEFLRIDERFTSIRYKIIFLIVFIPQK